MRILFVSANGLSDRILLYTRCVPSLLSEHEVAIWTASSKKEPWHELRDIGACVEPLNETACFREFPTNYIRRVNDRAWMFRLKLASKLSELRHKRSYRANVIKKSEVVAGRLIAALGAEGLFDSYVQRVVLDSVKGTETMQRLQAWKPSLVVVMGPHLGALQTVAAAAKAAGSPVTAFILSFDNLSTKTRLCVDFDGYFLWSNDMEKELCTLHPKAYHRSRFVVGAPQYDVFYSGSFIDTREDFCRQWGLDPEKPVILAALGNANGVEEWWYADTLAREVSGGRLRDVQLLVRPHPFFSTDSIANLFSPFGAQVRVQWLGRGNTARGERCPTIEEMRAWASTFAHANVVVHLSSTVAIDAAHFDRPSVCVDYDPAPDRSREALIREVNHKWSHYKPLAEGGGMRLARSPEELIRHVRSYLDDATQDSVARKRMVMRVCGYTDGLCGERLARAILAILEGTERGRGKGAKCGRNS